MDNSTGIQDMVPVLLALQFAAFGWRINREITLGDQRRKTWLPIPDFLNIISMVVVVLFCIVVPLAKGEMSFTSRIILTAGCTLIGFHPITMAGHYRLFSSSGRSKYTAEGRDYPYVTDQEIASLIASVVATLAACSYVSVSITR